MSDEDQPQPHDSAFDPDSSYESEASDVELTAPIRPVGADDWSESEDPFDADVEHTRPFWPPPSAQTDAPGDSSPEFRTAAGEGQGDSGYDYAPMAAAGPVSYDVVGQGSARGVRPPRGRVSFWVWPAIAALALVVGLAGGFAGGLIWDRYGDDSPFAESSSGLDTADIETTPPLPADNGSIAAVAQQLLPSTVQISAEVGGQAGGATGSGFILDREGHVVTNNHVVEGAADTPDGIQILDQNGDRYAAELVGRSPVYDLAVLYVPEAKDMQPASLGKSANLQIGEGVVALGSPLGLNSTVTSGIVSALNRPVTTGSTSDNLSYINAVQTDAAINPGNSGGPLVDLQGQVVGVNSAIATAGAGMGEAGNIGVGFAIPVEQVRVTADQILTDGEARYPVIGAQVNTGQGEDNGGLVVEVMPGTPAEKAGLRKDDLITAVEGDRVTDGIALIVAIRTHRPGETIEFTVQRGGQEQQVEVTLDGEVG